MTITVVVLNTTTEPDGDTSVDTRERKHNQYSYSYICKYTIDSNRFIYACIQDIYCLPVRVHSRSVQLLSAGNGLHPSLVHMLVLSEEGK